VSRVCRVQGLSCPGFVVSRVCRVQGLSVQGLSVQGLSVQGLSVQGLSVYQSLCNQNKICEACIILVGNSFTVLWIAGLPTLPFLGLATWIQFACEKLILG
jgi:hypothetical protein